MSTELDEAVARLKACVRPEHTWPFPDADVRLLLADWERRGERIAEFERLQAVWLMSPEAAKRLEGYRELAAECAALEGARDAAWAEVERLRAELPHEAWDRIVCDMESELTATRMNGRSRRSGCQRPTPGACALDAGVAALLSERGDLKAEVARLRERDAKAREAFGLIAWMAKEYAEAGGSGGPELRTYNDAMRLLEETP